MDDELKKDARFSDEKIKSYIGCIEDKFRWCIGLLFVVSYLDSQCKVIHFRNARSFPYIGKKMISI